MSKPKSLAIWFWSGNLKLAGSGRRCIQTHLALLQRGYDSHLYLSDSAFQQFVNEGYTGEVTSFHPTPCIYTRLNFANSLFNYFSILIISLRIALKNYHVVLSFQNLSLQ